MSLSISSISPVTPKQSTYQTNKTDFPQEIQTQQELSSTPGKLNRMLTQEEKKTIQRNFNLARLDHQQAEKLVSYLEQRGVISPRPQVSEEEEYPNGSFMLDTSGARTKPITGYSSEQGVSIDYLTPKENDNFFLALTKQVEIGRKIIKSSKWIEQETEADKVREPYQEELLKSLAVIYSDTGNGSVIAAAKSEVDKIYAISRDEYNQDLRNSAGLTNRTFSEISGAIPAINELLGQALKTVSNHDHWMEAKGQTLSEWMTMFDAEK